MFDSIYKACFAVTLDNGGLNRYRSEEQIKQEFDDFIVTYEARHLGSQNLFAIDAWFSTLSVEQMKTATGGEESEIEEMFLAAPFGANQLLNAWFDEHC